MWVPINTLCKTSLESPIHATKILQAENGQKVDKFESILMKKWFAVFKHTINHLSFGSVRLLQLEYYVSCFVSFFLPFFPLLLSTFKLLNTLYLKFE